MLTRPMIAAATLVLLLGAGTLLPPPAGSSVPAAPDEPGTVVLPEAPTYQAVAADVDGDGVRELVRLVGAERAAIDLEAWQRSDAGWSRIGEPVNVVPPRPTGTQGNIVYSGAPARIVVRLVDGVERATVVRQPRFEEPGLDVECCLLLDDVLAAEGSLRLVPVAARLLSADAVLAIDMDGDGTDEVLVTRGRPPLGDTTFPTDARVLRWTGSAFAPPVLTELAVGSGASPFVLGDTDGVPGAEAAFIGAQSRLHRLSLRENDALVAEDGGPSIADAVAVALEGDRAIAILNQRGQIIISPWPRDGAQAETQATRAIEAGDLVGTVEIRGRPHLLVRGATVETLQVLTLPNLTLESTSVIRSPAAGTLSAGPLQPYVGSLPGGSLDGHPAVIYAGHLIPSEDLAGSPYPTSGAALMATLAGTVPVGLVGPDRGWLALWHRALPSPIPDPSGGRLDAPVVQPGSGVSLVPVDAARVPELDDAILDPPISGGIDTGREVVTGAAGFTTTITAPPGSRVYLAAAAGASRPAITDVAAVPADGELTVTVQPPDSVDPDPTYTAQVAVATPAGHAYLATWIVRVLDGPPNLQARADTPIGSAAVVVSGRTAPFTEVRIDGRAVAVDAEGRFEGEVELPPWPTSVEVVAIDRVGNEARTMVSGVGWFDYRRLPWIAIAIAAVALVGSALYLRVPLIKREPQRADDDAVLEELDPD
jgi:hypothetical protein